MRMTAAALLVLALTGCANNWAKYYQGTPDARALPNYDASESVQGVRVYSTNDIAKDRLEMFRRGYVQIGASAFNAGSDQGSERQLRQQAEKVGAHVVLVGSTYTNTVSGVMPLTTPTTSTSYTTGHATAYGAGGTVNAYGNSTTTIYGSQTTMIPYSIARSDFGAAFFAKSKTHTGIFAAPLDDATKQRIGSNKGVLVQAVVDGSPAFQADVLPGDVVQSINDESTSSPQQYQTAVNRWAGTKITLKLIRGSQEITKQFDDLRY